MKLKENTRSFVFIVRRSITIWKEHEASSLASSLAYFALFTIPPLLLITLLLFNTFFSSGDASVYIFHQIEQLAGERIAHTIQQSIGATEITSHNAITWLISIFALLFGATKGFTHLQHALDSLWDAQPLKKPSLYQRLKQRFLAFCMVAAVGCFLVASVLASSIIHGILSIVSADEFSILVALIDIGISFIVLTVGFTCVYTILPQTTVRWKDACVGGIVTSVLFIIGKIIFGVYISISGVTSTFGASSSIVIVLLWIYYSTLIFLFGAAYTRAYADIRTSSLTAHI